MMKLTVNVIGRETPITVEIDDSILETVQLPEPEEVDDAIAIAEELLKGDSLRVDNGTVVLVIPTSAVSLIDVPKGDEPSDVRERPATKPKSFNTGRRNGARPGRHVVQAPFGSRLKLRRDSSGSGRAVSVTR